MIEAEAYLQLILTISLFLCLPIVWLLFRTIARYVIAYFFPIKQVDVTIKMLDGSMKNVIIKYKNDRDYTERFYQLSKDRA